MKELLAALGNKYFLWVLIGLIVTGGLFMRSCQVKENERLQTYNRQLQGQLSDKERELQAMHAQLGVAQSELVTQQELAERLEKDKEEVDKEFDKFRKEHDLQIRSRDKTIARLRQSLSGGTSEAVVIECKDLDDLGNCIISYNWQDLHKRFKLKDPNIFKEGDELFESDQLFKVYGEIWEQKDGSLQIRRLVLREVFLNDKGEYEPITDGKADILDSKFEYHNPPTIDTEWSWKDLFRLRAIAVPSITTFPDSGRTRLGVGLEFFNWKGLGINTHTAFDFKDAEKIEQRLGIAYNPTIFDVELNLAIGVSVGTPFAHMFNDYSVNLDLLFYINN